MKKSLLERAAKLLANNDGGLAGPRWIAARAQWVRDYERRCRADFSGESQPDHRGCPKGAECWDHEDDIYWRPE
jgi:hypothetical protein